MTADTERAQGTVVALAAGRATVRVGTGPSCPRCAAGRGCGAAFPAGNRRRLVEVTVPPELSLAVGQQVGLSLEPARLLKAAWLAYGIPLVALLGATLAAAAVLPAPVSDLAAFSMAATGLAGAAWWARRRLRAIGCPGRFVPSLEPAAGSPPPPAGG